MNDSKITVRMPRSLKAKLNNMARDKKTSVNAIIRECLENEVKESVKPHPAPNLAG